MKPLALSLVALLALPLASASAAPRPCRPLVADPIGDAHDWALPGNPDHPELDVTAVRMATVSDGLDMSLSVVKMSGAMAASGYHVFFGLGSYEYLVSAHHEIDGDSFAIQSSAVESNQLLDEVATIPGSVDTTAGVVHWRVPWSVLHGTHRGQRAFGVQGATDTSYGVTKASVGNTIDGTDKKSYRIGASGCG